MKWKPGDHSRRPQLSGLLEMLVWGLNPYHRAGFAPAIDKPAVNACVSGAMASPAFERRPCILRRDRGQRQNPCMADSPSKRRAIELHRRTRYLSTTNVIEIPEHEVLV
jgi:hypothetical protein